MHLSRNDVYIVTLKHSKVWSCIRKKLDQKLLKFTGRSWLVLECFLFRCYLNLAFMVGTAWYFESLRHYSVYRCSFDPEIRSALEKLPIIPRTPSIEEGLPPQMRKEGHRDKNSRLLILMQVIFPLVPAALSLRAFSA